MNHCSETKLRQSIQQTRSTHRGSVGTLAHLNDVRKTAQFSTIAFPQLARDRTEAGKS